MIDYVSLMNRLFPKPDGEAPVTLRTATVTAIDADGTADISLSGVTIANVPVLGGAVFIVGTVVQVLSTRGSLLIIGGSGVKSTPVEQASANSTVGTMSGSGFTNSLATTGTFGVAFIAPPSGRVAVFARANGSNSTVAGQAQIDFEVKTGSVIGAGSGVWGPDDLRVSVLQVGAANEIGTLSVSGIPTGLTPGAAYHADMVYRSNSVGTAGFSRRHVMVLPQ